MNEPGRRRHRATLNNATGVVGVVANGSLKLHIVKVFGAVGWAYSSTLDSAANKCKAAGAHVISMSLGGSVSSRTEQNAFASLLLGGILPIAALVWALNPNCTASQLRTSLNLSAQDLGAAGRDTKFGYGLVQAKAADARIKAQTCGK